MLIRVANLIFASLAVLSYLSGLSRHHHIYLITGIGLVMDLLFLFWFAGAVGLFFHKRLAWVGSLLGVGASVCFFAVCLVAIIALNIYPNTDAGLFRDINTSGAVVFGLGEFSLLFALSLGLFIGLLKMRKELK